jgi:PhnB protein
MILNVHLFFDGNCKQAFEFYEKCLGQKIHFIQTYGDSPEGDKVPAEMKNRVMHASIMVGQTQLMGADGDPAEAKHGGFAISADSKDPAEAERIFAALSEGGEVRLPIQETFWAQRFGMLTDKFGVPWMVNCSKPM